MWACAWPATYRDEATYAGRAPATAPCRRRAGTTATAAPPCAATEAQRTSANCAVGCPSGRPWIAFGQPFAVAAAAVVASDRGASVVVAVVAAAAAVASGASVACWVLRVGRRRPGVAAGDGRRASYWAFPACLSCCP